MIAFAPKIGGGRLHETLQDASQLWDTPSLQGKSTSSQSRNCTSPTCSARSKARHDSCYGYVFKTWRVPLFQEGFNCQAHHGFNGGSVQHVRDKGQPQWAPMTKVTKGKALCTSGSHLSALEIFVRNWTMLVNPAKRGFIAPLVMFFSWSLRMFSISLRPSTPALLQGMTAGFAWGLAVLWVYMPQSQGLSTTEIGSETPRPHQQAVAGPLQKRSNKGCGDLPSMAMWPSRFSWVDQLSAGTAQSFTDVGVSGVSGEVRGGFWSFWTDDGSKWSTLNWANRREARERGREMG